MIREQENHKNIALITLPFETANPNICITKHFLTTTFAVLYFSQKETNDTPINHVFLGKIQDNINAFHENYIDFFVKLYTHERPGKIHSNPVHHSIKRE